MSTEKEKSIFLQEMENEGVVKSVPAAPAESSPAQKVKKKKSAVALFVSMFLLFLLLLSLFIFVMSTGGSGNPILKTFGVSEDGTKAFLLKTVNGTFAMFGVILLLCFASGIFMGVSAKDRSKRRGGLVFAASCFGLIFPVILAWLGMWNFVNAFVVESSASRTQIMILNESADLVAPVDLEFSAEKVARVLTGKGKKIQGFAWDFGNGVFQDQASSEKIIHNFKTTGVFPVRLEVIFENGESEIFNRELRIDKARFAATPENGSAPLRVEFDASNVTAALDVETFHWDFDDGSQENAINPSTTHVFEKIGKYSVRLRAIETSGNVKLFENEIVVTGESADRMQGKIKVSPSESGSAPFFAKFDAADSFSSDGKIVEFQWDFGDGSETVLGQSTQHTFRQPGNFIVQLKVKDEFGTTKAKEIEITVNEGSDQIAAKVRTQPQMKNGLLLGTAPLFVEFDASDSTGNAVKFQWDFQDDGKVDATGSRADFTFRESGDFQTVLKIENAAGEKSETRIPVQISKQKIKAEFSADPENGVVPLTVNFDASESWCNESDCSITSFQWDFDDGTQPQLAGAQVKHLFPQVGIFNVKLKIFTSTGKTAEFSKKIFVREIPLISCFQVSRTRGMAPLSVSFDPMCTTGTVEKWFWDFDDGTTSNHRRPSHTFQKMGRFQVTLQVFDDKNNVSQITQEIEVQ